MYIVNDMYYNAVKGGETRKCDEETPRGVVWRCTEIVVPDSVMQSQRKAHFRVDFGFTLYREYLRGAACSRRSLK